MERLFKNSPRILYPRFDSRKRRHVMSKQTNNKACQGSRHYWSLLGGRLTCGGVTSASRRRRLMPAFSHRGHVASRGCNADNVTKMTGGIPYIPPYIALPWAHSKHVFVAAYGRCSEPLDYVAYKHVGKERVRNKRQTAAAFTGLLS